MLEPETASEPEQTTQDAAFPTANALKKAMLTIITTLGMIVIILNVDTRNQHGRALRIEDDFPDLNTNNTDLLDEANLKFNDTNATLSEANATDLPDSVTLAFSNTAAALAKVKRPPTRKPSHKPTSQFPTTISPSRRPSKPTTSQPTKRPKSLKPTAPPTADRRSMLRGLGLSDDEIQLIYRQEKKYGATQKEIDLIIDMINSERRNLKVPASRMSMIEWDWKYYVALLKVLSVPRGFTCVTSALGGKPLSYEACDKLMQASGMYDGDNDNVMTSFFDSCNTKRKFHGIIAPIAYIINFRLNQRGCFDYNKCYPDFGSYGSIPGLYGASCTTRGAGVKQNCNWWWNYYNVLAKEEIYQISCIIAGEGKKAPTQKDIPHSTQLNCFFRIKETFPALLPTNDCNPACTNGSKCYGGRCYPYGLTIKGDYPYEKGIPCSRCPTGTTCKDKLCV